MPLWGHVQVLQPPSKLNTSSGVQLQDSFWHVDADLLPSSGHWQKLQVPGGQLKVLNFVHCPHIFVVQLVPLAKHRHSLQPSSAMYVSPTPTGHSFAEGQASHMAGFTIPDGGQMHGPQPSIDWNVEFGVHESDAALLVQVAPAGLPLGGQMHELFPSMVLSVDPGVQPTPAGHAILVHGAKLALPLAGHMQVLQPSFPMNVVLALQVAAGEQAFCVQAAILFFPDGGQLHVLQPSSAVNSVFASHVSGVSTHAFSVQAAVVVLPLGGHTHELHPSSAVKVSPGVQLPAKTLVTEQLKQTQNATGNRRRPHAPAIC